MFGELEKRQKVLFVKVLYTISKNIKRNSKSTFLPLSINKSLNFSDFFKCSSSLNWISVKNLRKTLWKSEIKFALCFYSSRDFFFRFVLRDFRVFRKDFIIKSWIFIKLYHEVSFNLLPFHNFILPVRSQINE